jgi:hypothetical protein
MKTFFLLSTLVMNATALASAGDCKSKALQVAKAIDRVYVPKLAKGTEVTMIETARTKNSRTWLVNFYVPNAGGATSYSIEMQNVSCEIVNLWMVSE